MSRVKKEILGFRDERISRRHRDWGVGCPAIDIDFAMLEFNYNQPVAIVEYKHKNINKEKININHPAYQAICVLADNSNIPFLIAIYDPDIWFFEIIPVNDIAKRIYNEGKTKLTEQRFVKSLYALRGKRLDRCDVGTLEGLNNKEAA